MKSGTTSGGAPPGVVPEAQERRFPRGENSDGERDFRAAFDDQGRALRLELWLVMLLGVGAVLLFHRYLLKVPPELLAWGPLLIVAIGIPAVLRWLSGSSSPVRRWSQALFVVAAYLDIACMMAVRTICLQHGIDVLPIIVPVTILMSLVVVQIRFAVMVPAMLLGLAGLAVAELSLNTVTFATLFQLMASTGIVSVSLASAYELENNSRHAWLRQRELDELTRLDSLTGLPNRRYFDETLDAAVESAAGGESVLLAILDLDEFKGLNDRLGHAAGDECLAAIGAHLRQQIDTRHEFAARYAGEEFAVMWHGTAPEKARARAELLRESIGTLRIMRSDAGAVVTASAGSAEIVVPSDERPLTADRRSGLIQTLIDRADRALYQAKAAGRNRIINDRNMIRAADPHRATPFTADTSPGQRTTPELRTTTSTLRFVDSQDEAAFLALYEAQGRRTRRFIMIGLLLVCAFIFVFQESLLKIPPEASTFGRLTLGLGIAPAAVVALIGTSWMRVRAWSAPIYVGAVAVILSAQMFERAIQTPKGFDVVPYLMPVSVLLSLAVVQIVYRLLMPSMVALTTGIIVCELVSLPITGNEFLTICATVLMVFVCLRFAYLLELSRRLDWSRSRLLEELGSTDPLTRLPNRRAFIAELHRRLGSVVAPAVLLIDVDYFKHYNDRLGHPAGDDCLRAVADQLRGVTGECGGFAARLGGEEFAVILAGDAETTHTAEKVRAAVTGRRDDDGDRPRVTASAGLAAWPAGVTVDDPDAAASQLLRRADLALYAAKRLGRNRLEVDGGTRHSPV